MTRQPPQAPEAFDPVEPRPRARDRRNRNRRRTDWRGPAKLLLVLALVGQSLRVAFSSPRLRVQHVEVTGTQRLSAADVSRLGHVPVGRNIFGVNLVEVSRNLKRDPVIRETVVSRELPGTVNVSIRERTPAYQITSNGAAYHADVHGVVFQRAPGLTSAMPRLDLQPEELPKLGDALRPERLQMLKTCVRLTQQNRLAVTKMRVDGDGELWLNVTTNTSAGEPATLSVRVGRTTELPAKFQDIHRWLKGHRDLAEKAAYVDVMCPGKTAYLPRVVVDADAPASPAP